MVLTLADGMTEGGKLSFAVLRQSPPTVARKRTVEESPARAVVTGVCLSILITCFSRSGVFPVIDRSIVDATVILLPLGGAVVSARKLLRRQPGAGVTVVAVIYALAIVISGIVNGPGLATVFGMLLPGVTAVVLVLIGSLLTAREFAVIGRCIVVIALVQSVIAIAEVQLLAPWAKQIANVNGLYIYRPNLVIDGFGRATAAMGHPILLGLVCTAGAILLMSPGIVKSKTLRVIGFPLLFWAVVLSGSRSSIAALLVAFLVYFIHPQTGTKPAVRLLLILAVVPLTFAYINEAINTAREVSLFSLTNRVDAFPRLLETFERGFPDWLIGEGLGFNLETVADNQFLTTSGSYGLIGLVALILAVLYGIFSRNALAVACVSCFVFMSLSFDTLTWGFSAFMFWFMIGYANSKSGLKADCPLSLGAEVR